MLRRTKTTLINGKPILDLPARIVTIVECEFDSAERAFYNSVEQKVQSSLEQLQQGDINKAYTSVLVLLLRLRQGTRVLGLERSRQTHIYPLSVQPPWFDLEGFQEGSGSGGTEER